MLSNSFLDVGLEVLKSSVMCGDTDSFLQKLPSNKGDKFEKNFPEVVSEIPAEICDLVKEASCWGVWLTPEGSKLIPDGFVTKGMVRWELSIIGEIELDRQHFINSKKMKPISKKTKPIWNKTLAFENFKSLHNGNFYTAFLAMDTNDPNLPVYILDSYRNSKCNGFMLSATLEHFLDHWGRLAFIELSDESLAPLTENFTKPINAECSFAKDWLKWLSTGNSAKGKG